MNYEELWNALKEKIRINAAVKLENPISINKSIEEIAIKQTYFRILDEMSKMERAESIKHKEDNYSL